jgi:N-acetylmuramoyl-L-alanine amidase
MRYYTKQQFDSNIHVYEFSPTDCDSTIEFGKPGQYEPLSAITNKSRNELTKINLGFFGTTEHHGSVFNPSTIQGSAEGKGVECYLTKDGQFLVGNITDNQISNLKGNVQWGCSLSYAVVVNGKKGFTGSSNYSHFSQRNPRTLLGQKADKTMVLVVVEGRSTTSKGVTGDQSADIMLSLGCVNAINADGGGSSEMIVDGKIVNQLADGSERKIGSALVVYEKEVKSVDNNTFAFDAGHAGFGVTPGKRTTDGTMYEWDFNNAVAVLVEQKLLTYENVKVVRLDDRTGKKDIPLAERVAKALNEKVAAVVSIHANADGKGDIWTDANGIETFISDDRFPFNELELASHIQKHLIRETGRKNRGVKRGNLYMTKVSNAIPSVLCELGFMTNKEEAALLKSASYREKCATAIVNGLVEQFKLKAKVKVEIDQPQKEGEKVLNLLSLTGSQFQMLAKVYENAHKNGILSSDQWQKKATEKKLTVDEATFLNGVILGNLIK